MIVDFHSHVLPGIDDGSRSTEESLEMLKRMQDQGISAVVATPHFYASRHFPEEFLERRERAKEKILQAVKEQGVQIPKLYYGAEVAYFRGMSQSEALKDLVIEGTRAVMVEMPMGRWTSAMYDELEQIHAVQGLIPIVAHVDRYLGKIRDYGIPEKLAQLPVLVQANASFFLGDDAGGLSGGTVRKAMKLLKNEYIHLLGSDCHNLKDRGPNLGEAVKAIETSLGAEALEWIGGWQHEVLNKPF
ncbi:MAG: hypothetical protein IKT31_06460 [Firmicutes bacterium]|nr:hypothetical protein [Bacillota bacterium]